MILRTLQAYYQLTKPGIIRGNLLTATAGFLLASGRDIDPWLLLALLAGTSLVIASGCVFNNYIDRGIDKKMKRTQKRALVSGDISVHAALLYATLLGVTGLVVLALWTNGLTVLLGLAGLFFYVVVYGFAKRRSTLGTIIGSIPGALPPVAGYVAVSGSLDMGAFALFSILVCWQMPHFYAIAMFRRDDYAAAGLPVLPIVKGIHATKIQILVYIVAFTAITLLLPLYGYTGVIYTFAVTLIGVAWFVKGWLGFRTSNDRTWARSMFFFSLAVIMVFCSSIAVNVLLAG